MPETETKGFITLACGERFAEMALDMALSLREFHAEPVSICVDRAAAKRLARYAPLPFDRIIELKPECHAWGAKFDAAAKSPYSRTAFVDADVLFLRESPFLSYEFDGPLAMYGAYMTNERSFETYFPSDQIFADFGISRYFWATSGIFFFRSAAALFFKNCYDFYTKEIQNRPKYRSHAVPDELIFGILSDEYEIAKISCPTVHPWPMASELDTAQFDDERWPVLHVFAPVNEPLMTQVLSRVEQRRREAGFATRSHDIWLQKAARIPSFKEKLRHRLRGLRELIGI